LAKAGIRVQQRHPASMAACIVRMANTLL
jgi:hypothetical protein